VVALLRAKADILEGKKEDGFQLTACTADMVTLVHPGGEEVMEVISQGKTGGSGKRSRNKKAKE
jgi:hypothetical protein